MKSWIYRTFPAWLIAAVHVVGIGGMVVGAIALIAYFPIIIPIVIGIVSFGVFCTLLYIMLISPLIEDIQHKQRNEIKKYRAEQERRIEAQNQQLLAEQQKTLETFRETHLKVTSGVDTLGRRFLNKE